MYIKGRGRGKSESASGCFPPGDRIGIKFLELLLKRTYRTDTFCRILSISSDWSDLNQDKMSVLMQSTRNAVKAKQLRKKAAAKKKGPPSRSNSVEQNR